MPSQGVSFEVSDVRQLYRGGKPTSWEQMLERAAKSSLRRRSISTDEAREMLIGLERLHERGGAIPETPRECYLQLLEVLEPIPTPGAVP